MKWSSWIAMSYQMTPLHAPAFRKVNIHTAS
jgi:hypothetical protein